MHRARQGFVKARTAQANQLRGLLAEHGIIIPMGICHINQQLPDILEAGDNGLPGWFRQLLDRLSAHFKEPDKQVRELDVQLQIGIRTVRPARNGRRYRVSVHSPPARWLLPSAMPNSFRMAGSWQPGWGWFPGSTPAAASQHCCGW